MSDPNSRPSAGNKDPLAELLQQAGTRPAIDPLRQQRVERVVRQAWQAGLRRQRQKRWALALAACLALLAIGSTLHLLPIGTAGGDVAVVVHVQGRAHLVQPQGRRPLGVGDRLPADAVVETADRGSLVLSVERLASLRVAPASRLTLIDSRHFALHLGALYLDSDGRAGGVEVATPLLTASDVGTRFMVHHASGGSEVSVRDGEVRVAGAALARLAAGERLRLGADGQGQRSAIAAHAVDWDWARAAAVPFAASGRPLADLLAWYAHEAGLILQLSGGAELDRRLAAPLQGDMDGLSADELLEIARAAGPLSIRVDRQRGALHVAL
jgi:hypothetical protein